MTPNIVSRVSRWSNVGGCALALVLLVVQLLTYREVVGHNSTVLQAIENHADLQMKLIGSLSTGAGIKAGESILDRYLRDIRRDGPASHAAAKRKIDQLASNTEALLVLLDTYSPASEPGPLKKNTEEFRRYASVWLDRKNSVMDLYLLGGNFPPGEPEFPTELLQTLKQTD